MFNNPLDLSADQYMEHYTRNGDEQYRIFAVAERRRCGLYHVLYRLVWDRDGNVTLSEDHAFHFSNSPDWILGE